MRFGDAVVDGLYRPPRDVAKGDVCPRFSFSGNDRRGSAARLFTDAYVQGRRKTPSSRKGVRLAACVATERVFSRTVVPDIERAHRAGLADLPAVGGALAYHQLGRGDAELGDFRGVQGRRRLRVVFLARGE